MTNKQAYAGLLERLTAYSEALEAMRVGVSLEASQRLIKVTPALSAKAMAEAAEAISSLLKRVGELETALGHAVGIIEAHVDRDALGMGGDPCDGQWPLLDEYLHHMRAALNSDAPLSIGEGL